MTQVTNFSQAGIKAAFDQAHRQLYDSDYEEVRAYLAFDISNKIAQLEQQLSAMTKKAEERDAIIAMQAEALKIAYLNSTNLLPVTGGDFVKLENALSASAESVAAWELDKLHPLRQRIAELEERIKEGRI